ncbi:MAG: flippase-like domain-containing protein [Caldithrix sp.]|nr:flippase-like domain-containing protein [Caldithrix sp.]
MKYVRTILKALVSLGLLGYLIYKAGPIQIMNILRQIADTNRLLLVLLAVGLGLIWILLMSVRWSFLLRGYGKPVAISKLYNFYLIGLFFNNFLPTSVGGDVMRVYRVIGEIEDRTIAFSGVIIERMMGIAATLFLAIIALFFVSHQFHSNKLLYLSVSMFILILVFFFLLIRNRPFYLLLKIFEKFTILKIGEKFNKLFEAVHYFKEHPRVLISTFLISLLSQSMVVLMNYILAKAFGLNVSLAYLFLVVPVTFVLTMLPSINGVGIRDLGYVSLLSRVGISNAAAISLSVMNLLVPMFISLWGAALFIFQKRKMKMGEIDAFESSF